MLMSISVLIRILAISFLLCQATMMPGWRLTLHIVLTLPCGAIAAVVGRWAWCRDLHRQCRGPLRVGGTAAP
eukprot:10042405-Karenia_brevis.AAC.1